VDVYTNKAAIDILSVEDKRRLNGIVDTMNGMSYDELIAYMQQYLSKEAVDEYTKYLKVKDVVVRKDIRNIK